MALVGASPGCFGLLLRPPGKGACFSDTRGTRFGTVPGTRNYLARKRPPTIRSSLTAGLPLLRGTVFMAGSRSCTVLGVYCAIVYPSLRASSGYALRFAVKEGLAPLSFYGSRTGVFHIMPGTTSPQTSPCKPGGVAWSLTRAPEDADYETGDSPLAVSNSSCMLPTWLAFHRKPVRQRSALALTSHALPGQRM